MAGLNPFSYRGYVYDDETGLYYLQSRYYDPKTGRFLNADVCFDTESGSPLSTNMFAYCENNSIFSYDTNGYWIFYNLDIEIETDTAIGRVCHLNYIVEGKYVKKIFVRTDS